MSRVRTRPVAAATALILAVTGLTALTAAPAFAADGSVTGMVFRDFNAERFVRHWRSPKQRSGQRPRSRGRDRDRLRQCEQLLEHGLRRERRVPPATVVGAVDDALRIEFTNLPAGYQPGAVSSTSAANGTSVQFVSLGDADVDFSVNAPEDYSQPARRWSPPSSRLEPSTARRRRRWPRARGHRLWQRTARTRSRSGFPGRVDARGRTARSAAISSNVYQASSDSIYAAATYKRQSALGPLGLGGIYRVTDVTNAAGAISTGGGVESWLDVTLPPLSINLGSVPSNAARLLAAPNALVHDTDAFAQAGKVGIGGMALSPDGNTLYFINLFDKQLYSIDVSDPANPPTTYQSYDLGLGIGERPWAVRIHRGELYVGYVDSGETAAGSQPGIAAAVVGLQSHVIEAPLATLAGWTEVLTGTLGYDKGGVINNTLAPQSMRWNTWTDTWSWAAYDAVPAGTVAQPNGGDGTSTRSRC